MPTFYVCPTGEAEGESFWVYALDDFDAREQIASTLHIDALNESLFDVSEDTRFTMPLNIILHSSGEWTQVPCPKALACDPCTCKCDDETPDT